MPDSVTAIGTVSASVIVSDCCLDILAALRVCFAAENGLMTFASPQHFMQCIFRSLEGHLRRANQTRQWEWGGVFSAFLMGPVSM